MTRDEVKVILMAMLTIWPNYKPNMTGEWVDIWTEMIGDLDFRLAQTALKAYAQEDKSGFAPSVGQLRAKAVELTHDDDMTSGEAWAMVRNAISRSAYYSAEEFGKLPELVQKAVGSPLVLKTWAAMEETELDVARAQLEKKFTAEKARKTQRLQMSPDILRILESRPKEEPKQIEDTPPKLEGIPEEERIQAANRALERMKR